MEISITKNTENKNLSRKEIEFTVESEAATPSKAQLSEAVCKKLGLNPELTTITKVQQEYGEKKARVYVHSYDTKEAMAIEPKYIAARLTKKDKKAGGEKKEEKAEEKKEEKKE